MIPEIYIQQWSAACKWQMPSQVEQDLIISRALCDLYGNDHIQDALIFRGGTALNKLFLNPPARYSEDLDFVQKRSEPIGKTIDTIRSILTPWLGDPKWKITERSAKLIFKYESINKTPSKLKVEINTTEHFQVLPLRYHEFSLNSEWVHGKANITTCEIDELIATKLRALFQRRKGRDLFDLWYVLHKGLINTDRVIRLFQKYCQNDGIEISQEGFIKNLEAKKSHPDFHYDMKALLPLDVDWTFEESYEFVMENIIKKLL